MVATLPTFTDLVFGPFVMYIPAVILGLIIWAFLDTLVSFVMTVWDAINF